MARGELVQDMTKGNETSLLIKFMMPMLFGNIFQQLYNIADSIIVGRFVSDNALGAIGCTASVTFLFFAMCNGLATGAGIMVAQFFGASRDEDVKKTLTNSFYMVTIFGIFFSVLGVFLTRPALVLLDTPKAQLEDAVAYMQIACGGTIAVAIYNYAAQVMRALGDAKTPLIFLVFATILNVGLDFLFILGFDMGVKGAAYATIIAQAISAVGSLIFAYAKNPYFKLKLAHYKLDLEKAKMCISIGFPLAMQGFTIASSCVILQKFVNGFDAAVVTAFTVTSRIEQFVQQPFSSLSTAMSTFTGQNMGARKTERVRNALISAVKITAVISIVMLAVCYLAGEYIVGCFVEDPEVIAIGTRGLRIISLMFFPLGIIYVTRGLLNGANDTFYAMINGIIEVCCRVGFAILLVSVFPVGKWSVWLATGLTWVVTGIAGTIRYKQGVWLKKCIATAV
ncbi:MAG: MATE family efflux transporter [Lachnospiraceae bacterium]|nr:MATE family efflux transporter [Lachnospiraceae bacterium]